MPRDGSGVFSPPAGTLATSGTAIESAKYNAFVNDLTADANAARPIVAGGTGATTAGAALTALGAQPLDAGLTSIAGLTTAADRMIYTTAADTYAVATLTAAGRAILDDANATAQLVTLGIGGDIPALEALASTGIAVRTAADTWATRTITAGSGISITNGDGVAGNIVVAASAGMTFSTAQATTSGTERDFTGIPSTAKRVTVMFQDVSLSGSAALRVQLGTSGGFVTTGYIGAGGASRSTSGCDINLNTATRKAQGTLTFLNISGTRWVGGLAYDNDGVGGGGGGYSVDISGALERVRFTTSTGTDTFDSGSVNVMWE